MHHSKVVRLDSVDQFIQLQRARAGTLKGGLAHLELGSWGNGAVRVTGLGIVFISTAEAISFPGSHLHELFSSPKLLYLSCFPLRF